jgi:hypothetical protein
LFEACERLMKHRVRRPGGDHGSTRSARTIIASESVSWRSPMSRRRS